MLTVIIIIGVIIAIIIGVIIGVRVGVVNGQNGPGRGSWVVMTPESQGLDSAALNQAASDTFNDIPGRYCFLVVKNGFIVHESYYNGWSVNSTRDGWSTTKSHCSSLFGIARQQGWANVSDYVRDRNDNTRECNPEARFQNVLLMNAEGDDMNDPTFWYDANGLSCLDTLTDFIEQNNPQGLTAESFARQYFADVLGMEDFTWENDPDDHLNCGGGSILTCRDLARAGQLWLNEGMWEGEQIIDRLHILEGRQFPTYSEYIPYGYNVWLDPYLGDDPIDPGVHAFIGNDDQAAIISKPNEVLIITMGTDASFGPLSWRAWFNTREAIVSNVTNHVTNVAVITI